MDIHDTCSSRTRGKLDSHCEPNGSVTDSLAALRKRVQSSAEKRRTGAHLADKSTYSLPQAMRLPQPSNLAKQRMSGDGSPLQLLTAASELRPAAKRRSAAKRRPARPGVSVNIQGWGDEGP